MEIHGNVKKTYCHCHWCLGTWSNQKPDSAAGCTKTASAYEGYARRRGNWSWRSRQLCPGSLAVFGLWQWRDHIWDVWTRFLIWRWPWHHFSVNRMGQVLPCWSTWSDSTMRCFVYGERSVFVVGFGRQIQIYIESHLKVSSSWRVYKGLPAMTSGRPI